MNSRRWNLSLKLRYLLRSWHRSVFCNPEYRKVKVAEGKDGIWWIKVEGEK